jgi:hypothetical protein
MGSVLRERGEGNSEKPGCRRRESIRILTRCVAFKRFGSGAPYEESPASEAGRHNDSNSNKTSEIKSSPSEEGVQHGQQLERRGVCSGRRGLDKMSGMTYEQEERP